MKTYDRHEVKKGGTYYYVPLKSFIMYKVKCWRVVLNTTQGCFAGASFVRPGDSEHLNPREIRQEIFHNLNKAQEVCIKRAKKAKKEINLELTRLENLTKKDLKK